MTRNYLVGIVFALYCALQTTDSIAARIVRALSESGVADHGIDISAEALANNSVMVYVEFSPTEELNNFRHVELELTSGTENLLSATLKPIEQTSGKVRVAFSTTPEMLAQAKLTVVVQPFGSQGVDGYKIPLHWLKPD